MPLNEFLKRLLGCVGLSSTCTSLRRSAAFRAGYETGLQSGLYSNLAAAFFKAFHYQLAGLPSGLRVQAIQAGNRQGLILFYDTAINPKDFIYFFEFLKEQILALDYTLHCADKLNLKHERYAEQKEKYILVPPASDIPGTSLVNQRYGNIALDFVKVNEKPGYIRLVADAYTDPYFSEALPFTELLQEIMQPDA